MGAEEGTNKSLNVSYDLVIEFVLNTTKLKMFPFNCGEVVFEVAKQKQPLVL